jgi:hypothetical protein
VISTAEDASLVTMLETKDNAFLKRVMTAMDKAAKANPRGKRTI